MNTRMHRQQRGIATLIVVLLLITGVLFVLSQSSSILQQRSDNTSQDLDSQAAVMIAESGLERAQAIVTQAQLQGTMSDATCGSSGVTAGAPFTIGSGTLSYGTSVALPTGCTASQCTSCQVQATGTVGSAKRTLNATYTLGTAFGVAGRGTTVTMVLSNTFNAPTVALFELGWRRQGAGGNSAGTSTTPVLQSGETSTLMWNLESSQGNRSAGAIGTGVTIAANTFSPVVKQTLNASRDYVEVGGLYPAKANDGNPTAISTTIAGTIGQSTITVGSSSSLGVGMTVAGTGIGAGARISAISGTTVTLSVVNTAGVTGNGSFKYDYPLILGSYYGNSNQNPQTAFSTNSATAGSVLNGSDPADTTACEYGSSTTPVVPNPGAQGGTYQKCRTWCLDRTSTATKGDPGKADTLVFGISPRSGSVADVINSVSFNTAASGGTYNFPAQNLALNKLVHFPNTDGSTSTASGAVYSEEWYYHNLPYTSSGASGFGASAYRAVVLGSAGTATLTLSTGITPGGASLSATSVSGPICVGDTINLVAGSNNNKVSGRTILSTPGGAQCSSSGGTYNLDPANPIGNGSNGTVSGNVLTFTSKTFFPTSSLNTNPLPTGATVSTTTTSGGTATFVNGATTYTYYPLTAPIAGTNILAYAGQTSETATVDGASQTVYRIYVPPGTPLPQVPYSYTDTTTTPSTTRYIDTILQVYKTVLTGGVVVPLQAGAKVATVDPTTNSFTVVNNNSSGTPVPPGFVGVQLCGGICALFSDPGNLNGAAVTTGFTVNKSTNTAQWASGFMCLSGVYGPNIVPIQSSVIKDRRWWESVQ
ncbi:MULTISPECIES: hypothetical protein [Ramlibacter]|uniref:Type 4 fimbrial biogenesis protein PilX N-terminal domain-containing protein n=1 Tax=Ramlibacter aquaticus TaxID=2780094 RepID=A0ABR9SAB6_9BURK|nr:MULTISPECIES: hypothetical protein [Ramlibacter]MBE7939294.1 hypothetical protein [Ramlibacter aquaticus]